MTGLEHLATIKAIDTAAKKSEGLIKTLFGKAFEEGAEMIRDNVRLRRFNNQIKILDKAKEKLKDQQIDPNKLNLKVIAPLLEFTSLEEDENLQELWANLIKNIVSKPLPLILQKNAVEMLSKLSNEEVVLLDLIYTELIEEREKKCARRNKRYPESEQMKPEQFGVNGFLFSVKKIAKLMNLSLEDTQLQVSGLASFGILRYSIEATAFDSSDGMRMGNHIGVGIFDNDNIKLSETGLAFIEICK